MILSETRRNTGRYANGKILEKKEKKDELQTFIEKENIEIRSKFDQFQ